MGAILRSDVCGEHNTFSPNHFHFQFRRISRCVQVFARSCAHVLVQANKRVWGEDGHFQFLCINCAISRKYFTLDEYFKSCWGEREGGSSTRRLASSETLGCTKFWVPFEQMQTLVALPRGTKTWNFSEKFISARGWEGGGDGV